MSSNGVGSIPFIVVVFVCTISAMKMEFDPGKDAVNTAKHGVL